MTVFDMRCNMKTLVTEQGTATPETALCEQCYLNKANQGYAREMASRTDDINPENKFVDCSENEAIECCICGKDIFGNIADIEDRCF